MKIKNDTLINFLQFGGKVPDDVSILNHWNSLFAGYKGIKGHKSLDSKVLQITNVLTGEAYWKTLGSIINEVFIAGYGLEQVISAIDNYFKVITSEGYFYNKKWSLAEFLYKGITEKKGFIHFLNENNPLDKLKKDDYNVNDKFTSLGVVFKPITKHYDHENIYNRNSKTYYGFSLSELKNIKMIRKDLDYYIANNTTLSFGYFCFLEQVLASLLFFRKKRPDFNGFAKYIVLWSHEKEKWEKEK